MNLIKVSLNEESGYKNLTQHFQENQSASFDDWLEVVKIFPRPGKQGLVGLVKSKKNGMLFVFKISQHLNYLVQQELTIMKYLNQLSDFCPHFCRGIGGIIASIDPSKRKQGNPFKITSKSIQKEVLLMEYIKNSSKLYNYIKTEHIADNNIYSAIKQVLLAVGIAQRKNKFSHYDLHSNNVMMKKCNKDLVFLYVFDDQNQFCIPTYGTYAIVIDFGFSYAQIDAETPEARPLWTSLAHTKVGFMSDRFDFVADPKLFLVSVSKELTDLRKSKYAKKLRNITKNLFSPLNISWTCGWDKSEKDSAINSVLEKMEKYNKVSELFKKYDYFCVELFESLIILPLEKPENPFDETSFKTSFCAFIDEFIKIENMVGTHFHCIYILKGIVDIARDVYEDYSRKNTRSHALNYFRQNFHTLIDSVCKFCNPKIHYEKLLCSLYCLVKNMENILYSRISEQMMRKEQDYKKLIFKSPEEICAIIDLSIPSKYDFNENTEIIVIDVQNEQSFAMKLTKEQNDHVNEFDYAYRGNILYKIFKS